MEAKIGLVEVFTAPQGEGYNAGRWALFVRFAGCNLACKFADGAVCDTPYQQSAFKVTVDELFDKVLATWTPRWPAGGRVENLPMLVLTGGEPTLSPQFDAIVERARKLGDYYVAVETNGTTWTPGLGAADWISVSPKTDVMQGSDARWHNKNPDREAILAPALVEHMRKRASWGIELIGGGEYRYVISATSPAPLYHPANKHYLSPAALSNGNGNEWHAGFKGFAPGAIERCIEIVKQDPRWRISTQQHKIWGVR